MSRLLHGIPGEAVAFAAGVHAVSSRTWVEIACSLALLGFGSHSPAILEAAVGDWGIERVESAMEAGGFGVDMAIVRGGRPS